jgi:hypothetical protein
MGPTDLSQTERIRRRRAQIQALSKAAEPTRPELQPPPTSESIYLSRKFGQMEYLRPNATGLAVATSCCDSGPGTTG